MAELSQGGSYEFTHSENSELQLKFDHMNEQWTITRNNSEILYETHSTDLPLSERIWETTNFEGQIFEDVLKVTLALEPFEDYDPIQKRVTGGVDYSEVLPWMASIRV